MVAPVEDDGHTPVCGVLDGLGNDSLDVGAGGSFHFERDAWLADDVVTLV